MSKTLILNTPSEKSRLLLRDFYQEVFFPILARTIIIEGFTEIELATSKRYLASSLLSADKNAPVAQLDRASLS